MVKPGIREERNILKKLEFSRIPFSGSLWTEKSDGQNKHFRVEVKSTEKKSYSLKKSIWQKIEREALETGKIPLMALDISGLELVVLELEVFKELYRDWKGGISDGRK